MVGLVCGGLFHQILPLCRSIFIAKPNFSLTDQDGAKRENIKSWVYKVHVCNIKDGDGGFKVQAISSFKELKNATKS